MKRILIALTLTVVSAFVTFKVLAACVAISLPPLLILIMVALAQPVSLKLLTGTFSLQTAMRPETFKLQPRVIARTILTWTDHTLLHATRDTIIPTGWKLLWASGIK